MYGQHMWRKINLEMKLFNMVYQALLEFHDDSIYLKPSYYNWMSNINMDFTEIETPILEKKSNGR